jgi:putative peptide zinc metalloprotease protein
MVDESFKPKLAKSKKWLLFEKKDGDVYCIGDESTGNFVKVPEDDLQIIEEVIKYFDGEHSIQWIHDHLIKKMDLEVPVDSVFEVFRKANLIENSPSENPDEFQITSATVIRKELDFFKSAPKLSGKVFFPLFYSTIIMLIAALVLLAIDFGGFMQVSSSYYVIAESTTLGMIISFAVIYLCSFIHESGHLFVGWFFGTPPREVRVIMYLGILPMLFLEIPNIYTLTRRRRIIIALAGIYTNLVTAAVAIITLFAFKSAPVVQQLLADIALLNLIIPFFILNPFLPGDGYFLAVNILKTPNIRRHAFERLRAAFKMKWSKQDALFICYAVISVLISAYFFYWFIAWFLSSIVETYTSLYMLLTFTDFLLLGLKVSFISLMLYSTVKTSSSLLRRMTTSAKNK